MDFLLARNFALQLDQEDPLKSYRDHFVIGDSDLVYFDGNSLGRMPKVAIQRARQIVEEEWGRDLIRGWNKGWWGAPSRVGDKIGKLIGAAQGQVVVSDTTSVNLYKLVMAALALRPERKRIVTDTLNFPSDLYIPQGILELLIAVAQDHHVPTIGVGSVIDDFGYAKDCAVCVCHCFTFAADIKLTRWEKKNDVSMTDFIIKALLPKSIPLPGLEWQCLPMRRSDP